jgi:endonuclease YncB( thermonuclease family)
VVISVHDGDTLQARCDDTIVHVRLAEIDAPELGQPFAAAATRRLTAACQHQPVVLTPRSEDRYGRTIARVKCRGRDASLSMVRSGYAWAFRRYLTDPAIATAEEIARDGRRGLWRDPNPIAPWDFRAARRKE